MNPDPRAATNIYLIRLQNGNAVMVQAQDEDEALRAAGIIHDPAVDDPLPEDPEGQLELVQEHGVGPQRYTIKPVRDLFLRLKLEDEGDFELESMSDETLNQIYDEYPDLSDALHDPRWLEAVGEERTHPLMVTLWEAVREAVVRERTRLFEESLGQDGPEER